MQMYGFSAGYLKPGHAFCSHGGDAMYVISQHIKKRDINFATGGGLLLVLKQAEQPQ